MIEGYYSHTPASTVKIYKQTEDISKKPFAVGYNNVYLQC